MINHIIATATYIKDRSSGIIEIAILKRDFLINLHAILMKLIDGKIKEFSLSSLTGVIFNNFDDLIFIYESDKAMYYDSEVQQSKDGNDVVFYLFQKEETWRYSEEIIDAILKHKTHAYWDLYNPDFEANRFMIELENLFIDDDC